MRVLYVIGGGIGNIVQATPAIKATAAAGHEVDLKLHCNSSKDLDIFQLPCVHNLFAEDHPKNRYDWQLNGPFTPGHQYKSKKFARPKIHYAQHIPEAKVYYSLAQQMGVKTPMETTEVALPDNGKWPKNTDTVAIYPGSKPDWAMKRWDKYDKLAERFENVVIVGTKNDIYSHGNPTWIKKPWKWPDNVEFFIGGLADAAFLISKCKMLIGGDGGLIHVGAGTGIPTFVLFGPSSTVKNKPYAPNAHVIAIDLPCRPCQFQQGSDGKQIFDGGKGSCYLNMKCMRDMSVQFVMDKIKEIDKKLL